VVWGSGRHDVEERGGAGRCLYKAHTTTRPSSTLVEVPGGHAAPRLVTMQ
jgi:hypothetical protein